VFSRSVLSLNAIADEAKPIPSNPDLAAADQLYKSGKFAEAADKYQAMVKADPNLVPRKRTHPLLAA